MGASESSTFLCGTDFMCGQRRNDRHDELVQDEEDQDPEHGWPKPWTRTLDMLCQRFPDAEREHVAAALRKTSGHGGKAVGHLQREWAAADVFWGLDDANDPTGERRRKARKANYDRQEREALIRDGVRF